MTKNRKLYQPIVKRTMAALSPKEKYRFQILKEYGFLVSFQGEPSISALPSYEVVKNYTFAKWKEEILGDDCSSVVVYLPKSPTGNKRVSTLRNEAGEQHLMNIIKGMRRDWTKKLDTKVDEAKKKTASEYTKFPRETLEDILLEIGGTLMPSTQEFFQNLIKTTSKDIDTEVLFKELVQRFDFVVKSAKTIGGTP